jgi:hypothetical protein
MAAGVIITWRALRDPTVGSDGFGEETSLRAIPSTAVLTSAAALGSLVGGRSDLAGTVAVFGLLTALVLFVVWSYAKRFGSRDGR